MSERVHDLYREHLGVEALERQRQAAKDYWACCGEHRFHRAMDALQSREEGEAVYDVLRVEGWYVQAAQALARIPL